MNLDQKQTCVGFVFLWTAYAAGFLHAPHSINVWSFGCVLFLGSICYIGALLLDADFFRKKFLTFLALGACPYLFCIFL